MSLRGEVSVDERLMIPNSHRDLAPHQIARQPGPWQVSR